MKELEEKLRTLKLRKARLFLNIEMLSEVNDSTFTQFGKLQAEIMKLEKEILRKTENPLDESN
jgi:chromosome segregation ATPase